MDKSFKDVALAYLKLGFSVFPCKIIPSPTGAKAEKKPLVQWENYQKKLPTEAEIEKWAKSFPDADVGIVTGSISKIAVIDIDEPCGFQEIKKYIPEALPRPICQTISGGEHWYFRFPEDVDLRNNSRKIPGCDLRAEGGFVVAPPSGNGTGKYAWKKDNHITMIEIPILPYTYLEKVCPQMSTPNFDVHNDVQRMSTVSTDVHNVHKCPQTSNNSMFSEGRRNEDIFTVAWLMAKGGAQPVVIYQACMQLALSCGLPEKEAITISNSAVERGIRKARNLAMEIAAWVESAEGAFYVKDVTFDLELRNVEDRRYAAKILQRMCENGKLVKYGERNGCYCTVKNELQPLDWRDAPTDEIPIVFPMFVEEFIKIMPKNIIVIAGSPNSGKTAFLLNVVKYNRELAKKLNRRIRYLSSEMSSSEMKSRLINFEDITLEEWTEAFEVYERSNNFPDAIDPEGINIIDFLEVCDEFWKVSKTMKDIYEKLTTGVAFIALQMKHGATMGRGAEFGEEKPRLYLTIDKNELTIKKGKNWRGITNPNGLFTRFKLIKGSKFIQEGMWDYKEEKKKK